MARPQSDDDLDYDDYDTNVGDFVYWRDMDTLDPEFAPVTMCVNGIAVEADYDPPVMDGKKMTEPERWYITLNDATIDMKKATGWCPLPKTRDE